MVRQARVAVGDVVVYKDTLLGKIVKTEPYLSVIDLIGKKNISLTGSALATSALGIVKGVGDGQIIFDNVVLSDTLKKGDFVVTKGDLEKGIIGYPPHLVIGKIVSVDKKASALFQRAELESLVDVSRLSVVFILVEK